MAQIINQESFGGNLGRNLGQSLGQGLSSGLQQLANQKLDRMHKKSIQHDLRSSFPEIPEETVRIISSKPVVEQLQILETLGQQRQQQHEQQAMAQQQQQASGLQQLQQPQESLQQQSMSIPDDHYTPEVMQQLEQQLSSPEAAQQFPPEELQKARNNLVAMQQKLMQNPVGVNPFPKEQPKTNPIAQPIAKEEQKLSKEERVLQHKEQQAADKETSAFYKQTLEQERAAKKMDVDTNRMLKLIEKGDLPNAAFYKILKNIEEHVSPGIGAAAGSAIGTAIGLAGGPLSIATGAGGAAIGAGVGAIVQPIATLLRFAEKKYYPDTEEFEKLSANFISGAKAIFGSRITDRDLQAFLDTVPTLAHTEKGKRAIIRNIQLTNKATEIKAKNMREIIKENNGHRPFDLQNLVEERSADELDKLATQFVG